MNGFEPLRRRIIDYTIAGQWSEVYDGPLEDCESEKLKVENVKLRELVRDMWQAISRNDGCSWDMGANCCTSDECNVSCRYWYRMKELGIEASNA